MGRTARARFRNNNRNHGNRNNNRHGNNSSNNNNRKDEKPPPDPFGEVITLREKIYAPVHEFPGCDFGRQLCGHKGSNIREMVKTTRSKIWIRGRGSTRDPRREEELAATNNPDHAHFRESLHVIIEVKAPMITAHQQMADTMKEVHYWLVPRTQFSDRSERWREICDEQDPAMLQDRLAKEAEKLKLATANS